MSVSVQIVARCSGCFAEATVSLEMVARWERSMGGPRAGLKRVITPVDRQSIQALLPEGWILFDATTNCTYCAHCARDIWPEEQV